MDDYRVRVVEKLNLLKKRRLAAADCVNERVQYRRVVWMDEMERVQYGWLLPSEKRETEPVQCGQHETKKHYDGSTHAPTNKREPNKPVQYVSDEETETEPVQCGLHQTEKHYDGSTHAPTNKHEPKWPVQYVRLLPTKKHETETEPVQCGQHETKKHYDGSTHAPTNKHEPTEPMHYSWPLKKGHWECFADVRSSGRWEMEMANAFPTQPIYDALSYEELEA
jgi:hypothetical protein